MEKAKNNWLDFFKSLKETNIRFNPRPWDNTLNEPSKTVIFTDDNVLHAEIVRKVDELLSQVDKKPTNWKTVTEEVKTTMKE